MAQADDIQRMKVLEQPWVLTAPNRTLKVLEKQPKLGTVLESPLKPPKTGHSTSCSTWNSLKITPNWAHYLKGIQNWSCGINILQCTVLTVIVLLCHLSDPSLPVKNWQTLRFTRPVHDAPGFAATAPSSVQDRHFLVVMGLFLKFHWS